VRLVVDASVVVKWFNVEEWTERALALRDDLIEGVVELLAPDHLIYEVGNALWKNRQLSPEDCASGVLSLLEVGIKFEPPSRDMLREAAALARRLGITFYDSLYVALSEITDAPLVTADEKQGRAAESVTKVVWLWEYKSFKT